MANFLKKHLKLQIAFALIFSSPLYSAAMGIIGGSDDTGTQPAYAALLAPDGTLTNLAGGSFPSTEGEIKSVTINSLGGGIIGGGIIRETALPMPLLWHQMEPLPT